MKSDPITAKQIFGGLAIALAFYVITYLLVLSVDYLTIGVSKCLNWFRLLT